jgi:hypothetical protein
VCVYVYVCVFVCASGVRLSVVVIWAAVVCVCVCVCVGRVDMCVCVFEPAFLCILALWKKRNACVRGFERACLCNQKEALNVRLPYVFVCCVLNRPTIAFQPDWKWRPRACLRVYVHVNICTDRLPCVPVHGKV